MSLLLNSIITTNIAPAAEKIQGMGQDFASKQTKAAAQLVYGAFSAALKNAIETRASSGPFAAMMQLRQHVIQVGLNGTLDPLVTKMYEQIITENAVKDEGARCSK